MAEQYLDYRGLQYYTGKVVEYIDGIVGNINAALDQI